MTALVVFCPRPAPGTWASGVLRELGAQVDLRPCGPGWPARDLPDLDLAGAACLLELDGAPGSVARPTLPPRLSLPRAAWLVDTWRKPTFHREIAGDCELVFHAHPAWAEALRRPSQWLPLCADEETFRPQAVEREWDVAFVGEDPWRAEPLLAVARRRGLRVHVSSPAGPGAKAAAASIYARSKVVFQRHLTPALDVRVFEALAAGRAVLLDERAHRAEPLAEAGREFLTYSSDEALEAALVGLLADDRRCAELEARAAGLAGARLGAKVRATELLTALEARFGPLRSVPPPTGSSSRVGPVVDIQDEPRVPAESRPPLVAATPDRPPPTGVRWLVVAGEEPAAAWLASYAERLGAALHTRGDEVMVLRVRRGRLPSRPSEPGEPTAVEVDLGPIPDAATAENATLLASSRFQRVLDAVAREHGPFHGLLGEPALGAVTAPPVAARLDLPFVLALEDCEVARRGNNLTRDQLYRSELEHWAVERSRLVVVPTTSVEEEVRRHYRACAVATSGWPRNRVQPPSADAVTRLRGRLQLPAQTALVRAPLLGREDVLALAADLGRRGRPAVVLGRDAGAIATEGGVKIVGHSTRGEALATLASACAQAVLVGREDVGAADVAHLARALGRSPEVKLDDVVAAMVRPGQRLAAWEPSILAALSRAAKRPAVAPAFAGSAP